MMHIISRKPFRDAAKQFPSSRIAIEDCYRTLKNGTFKTPDELHRVFPSLNKIQDRWWVIDISGGHLQLMAFIEFKHNRLYVRHIGSSGRPPAVTQAKAIALMDDFGDDLDLNQLADAMAEPEDLLEPTDDAPVFQLINTILSEAVRKNASDVHIEPFENRLAVRYRVDGVMQKMLDPPREIAPRIIARLKIMAKMNTAESRTPADGRMALLIAGLRVDVSVSTLPSIHGERVVLRLLDKQAGRLDDGARLVLDGKTSLEEVLRVTREVATLTGPLIFTKAAVLKVKELIEEEGNPDLMLRLFVIGDGWSGFQYGFTFDETIIEGDVVVKKEGVTFLIDSISFQYLSGTEVDYTEGLEGSKFVVHNPNATTPSTTK